ncbi:MAG: glycosyltransferase family 25 protein [Rubrivivax sp.]|nr:glycosyltransferase family 25 protein [Rubrivivax sp.]
MDHRLHNLHTWVINLDRATQRLARISAQLQGLGIPWTRLAAVDARALTPEQRAALDEPAYRRKHGMTPSPGELGCYLSHVQVMRALLASRFEFALVLEDDVLLKPALPAVLEALVAHRGRWDVAKLSAVHSGTPQPYLPITPQHQLNVMLTRCTGASAYLVNRAAAQAYVDRLLPMSLPYDHAFDQGWRLGIRFRLVTPTPCDHDDRIETTIVIGPNRKFAWWRRLPCFAWRLGNELRRVRHGLGQTWKERRFASRG